MQRKRRFLLVLPVLVTPFVVFLLWILGLVGPGEASAQTGSRQGLNLSLPGAVVPQDSSWDKLKFYEKADKDSAKLRQQMKQDPFYNKKKTIDEVLKDSDSKFAFQPYPGKAINQADDEERQVNERIRAIHRQMEKQPVKKKVKLGDNRETNGEVERLEKMMRMMNDTSRIQDPEMERINAMMEKIMDIQHPQRVSERMKKEEVPRKIFTVELEGESDESARVETNRFYSLDDDPAREDFFNSIAAVVHEDQKIQDGSVVKLRLSQSVFINGTEIPENEFVYGVARLGTNRMMVAVSGVQYTGNVLPVNLDAYSSDGMEGIPVQGSAVQETTNQVMDRSVQSLNLSGFDMNAGAQVAGAAMQAGKSLLKKNNKTVKVILTAGYPVWLKNVQ